MTIRRYLAHIVLAGVTIVGGAAISAAQSAHADPGDPSGPFATTLPAGCSSGAGFRASQFAAAGGGHVKVMVDGVRVLDVDFADSGTWRFDPPPHDAATRRSYRADFTSGDGHYSLQQNWVGPCSDGPPPASLPPLVITPNVPPVDATVPPTTAAPAAPVVAPVVADAPAQAPIVAESASAPAPAPAAVASAPAVKVAPVAAPAAAAKVKVVVPAPAPAPSSHVDLDPVVWITLIF